MTLIKVGTSDLTSLVQLFYIHIVQYIFEFGASGPNFACLGLFGPIMQGSQSVQ